MWSISHLGTDAALTVKRVLQPSFFEYKKTLTADLSEDHQLGHHMLEKLVT